MEMSFTLFTYTCTFSLSCLLECSSHHEPGGSFWVGFSLLQGEGCLPHGKFVCVELMFQCFQMSTGPHKLLGTILAQIKIRDSVIVVHWISSRSVPFETLEGLTTSCVYMCVVSVCVCVVYVWCECVCGEYVCETSSLSSRCFFVGAGWSIWNKSPPRNSRSCSDRKEGLGSVDLTLCGFLVAWMCVHVVRWICGCG